MSRLLGGVRVVARAKERGVRSLCALGVALLRRISGLRQNVDRHASYSLVWRHVDHDRMNAYSALRYECVQRFAR